MGIYSKKLKEELVTEVVVYTGNGMNIGIYPSKDRNYGDDAYFKVYNNEDFKAADKVARIKFSAAEYGKYHKEGRKVKDWKLNPSEKKKLDQALSDPAVWSKLVDTLNKVTGGKYAFNKPDYKKLKERVNK